MVLCRDCVPVVGSIAHHLSRNSCKDASRRYLEQVFNFILDMTEPDLMNQAGHTSYARQGWQVTRDIAGYTRVTVSVYIPPNNTKLYLRVAVFTCDKSKMITAHSKSADIHRVETSHGGGRNSSLQLDTLSGYSTQAGYTNACTVSLKVHFHPPQDHQNGSKDCMLHAYASRYSISTLQSRCTNVSVKELPQLMEVKVPKAANLHIHYAAQKLKDSML